MIFSIINYGMIINRKRKNCRLLIINFAKFSNFAMIKEENTIKYKKCGLKKVNQNYTVVNKRFESNILCGSKVLKDFDNIFEFYKLNFERYVLIKVFIFFFF